MITLTQQDLTQFDKFLQDIPFKYAYPIFKFLREKVLEEEVKKKELEKIKEQADD